MEFAVQVRPRKGGGIPPEGVAVAVCYCAGWAGRQLICSHGLPPPPHPHPPHRQPPTHPPPPTQQQEAIDIVRSVLTVGLDRAVSGIRVDAAGAVIKPPHSNGKQGNTQGQAKQPQAKKQRSGEPSGAAAGASVPAAAAAAGAAAHGVAQQLHAAPAVATAAPTEAH